MTGIASAEDLWIRRFHPSPDASARLVCLPHAGGSASFYYPVSQSLSPPVEVLAIQYPGRQDRRNEPGITSITELADRIVETLRGWTDRPLALFGHSMGSTVAFEVAARLEAMGVAVSALFVSGRRAPSRHREENVHKRSDDGIVAELRTLSGTEADLLGDEELLRMILPAIRSDYEATETYRYQPRPRLSCPIFAFIGDRDPRVDLEEVDAWANHTASTFSVRTFPGGHFYLIKHRTALITAINDHLASRRVDLTDPA